MILRDICHVLHLTSKKITITKISICGFLLLQVAEYSHIRPSTLLNSDSFI